MDRHTFSSGIARKLLRRLMADLDHAIAWYTSLLGWEWDDASMRARRRWDPADRRRGD